MFSTGRNSANKKALKTLELMSSGEWRCVGCGDTHNGLPDLGAAYPDVVGVPKEVEPNSALRMDGNFLSEDFCVMKGKSFLIRTVLKFPIQGREDEFGFGVWSTLSRKNFDIYVENFDDGFAAYEEVQWTSWFMTNLSYFTETFSSKTWVIPQPNRQRPQVLFMVDGHPITSLQRKGLEPTELLKIYDHYGCKPE